MRPWRCVEGSSGAHGDARVKMCGRGAHGGREVCVCAVHMHEWRSAEVGVPMTHLRAHAGACNCARKRHKALKARGSAWRQGAQRRAEGGELRCKCK